MVIPRYTLHFHVVLRPPELFRPRNSGALRNLADHCEAGTGLHESATFKVLGDFVSQEDNVE
jgi:hypothetical protein